MRSNKTKLNHVTEHDGSKWVELEVAEDMYKAIKATHEMLSNGDHIGMGWIVNLEQILAKARGEQ